MIVNRSEAFWIEIREKLLLVGQELLGTELVDDRIDLLAIVKQGVAAVLESKRGVHTYAALSSAAMISGGSKMTLFGTEPIEERVRGYGRGRDSGILGGRSASRLS